MTDTELISKYFDLKKEYSVIREKPIGNRIKPNGLLEQKIKKVFKPERAKEILTREKSYTMNDYENYSKITNELKEMRELLKDKKILTYDDEGNETIHR